MSRSAKARDAEQAMALYREFHRYEPHRTGYFPKSFAIPRRARRLGVAKEILYSSPKIDPETMRKPRRPQNYIHDHELGVDAYDTYGRATHAVPGWICECDALTKLGECLGFAYEKDGEVLEGEPDGSGIELYCIPSGRALLVIEKKRRVIALMWGGGLGVEDRGIVG